MAPVLILPATPVLLQLNLKPVIVSTQPVNDNSSAPVDVPLFTVALPSTEAQEYPSPLSFLSWIAPPTTAPEQLAAPFSQSAAYSPADPTAGRAANAKAASTPAAKIINFWFMILPFCSQAGRE
jgi:hypothetical protein